MAGVAVPSKIQTHRTFTLALVLLPFLLLQIAAPGVHCAAMTTSPEEIDHYELKRSHELATWLLSQLNQNAEYGPEYTTNQDLCRSQSAATVKRNSETNNYLYRLLNPSKRNSELINSLLRLPKTMNEVGRK